MEFGVETRVLSEAQLRELQENSNLVFNSDIGIETAPQIPEIDLSKGGILYFASTQPKKFYEIDRTLKYSRARLKLRDAIDILHWFHSADETSQTYIGNSYEKVEALLDRIYDDIGYEKCISRIKERGDDPENVIWGVNDTGSSFNIDYSEEPEFQQALHEKGLGAWPGVELGPVMDAQGGVKGFFSSLKRMYERKTKDGSPPPDLRGTDDNMYIFFKLTSKRQDIKFTTYYSRVPIEHTIQPKPKGKKGVLTTYHFSRSLDNDLTDDERQKSRAQLGKEYVGVHSSQALGFRKFLSTANVPQSLISQFAEKAERTKKFVIATQHNALPEDTINCKLDHPIIREHDFVHQSDRVNSIENRAYQELTYNADAVVLGSHDPTVFDNFGEYSLDMLDIFCSLIVDKQLRVETFENTPFYILDEDKTNTLGSVDNLDWNDPQVEKKLIQFIKDTDPKANPWLPYLLFLQYLHEKAFVKQEPRFLFTQMSPDDSSLVKTLKSDLSEARNKNTFIPHYENEEWGKDRTDLFEITILGSASTRVSAYTESAFKMGEWIVHNGWHLRTGGGRYGVMGAAANGGMKALINATEHDPQGHISAIQMPRTMQFEGAAFKQKEIAHDTDKLLRITPSFDDRMTSLFRSDICVAMASGIGTVQEVTRWLRLKNAEFEPLQNKHMILVNTPQEDGSGQIRIMDMMLSLIPQHIVDTHLTIVNDVETAQDKIIEIFNEQYEAKYSNEFDVTPHPAL